MGDPDNPTPNHDAVSKPTTSFGRLKAATGLVRSKQPDLPPLVLSPQDVIDQPAPTHAGPSVLSANVDMTGSLNSPAALHIYGVINGNVRAADLTIFAGGSIKGDVVADSVLVHGSIEGRIHARKVQLCSGAVVRGDIVHASLGVDAASTFEGVSKRSDNPTAEARLAAVKRNGSATEATRCVAPAP
jgi:cytoskeletal protein CcmA (bactofilin family)